MNHIYKIFLMIFLSNLNITAASLTPTFNKLAKPIKASEIILKNADDEVVKLSDFRGKTVLLNFWATWCPPCKKEMPDLQKLYLKSKSKDIIILAIAVGQTDDDVFPFINTVKPTPTFPILFDINSNVARQWSIHAMPTTIIIDKEGYLTHFALGARDFNSPQLFNSLLEYHKK
jgi:thiol-disulfide isomerase/thioredoxin